MDDHDLALASPQGVSRRVMLGALAGGVILTGTSVTPAWAAGAEVQIRSGDDLFQVAVASGDVVDVPRMLGGAITVTSGSVEAGAWVKVSWDDRLYLVSAAPLLIRGEQVVPCHFQREPRVRKNTGNATVVLDENLVAGEPYVLSLGSSRQLRYPDDVIDGPHSTAVTLTSAKTSRKHQAKPHKTSTKTKALWGASVNGGWDLFAWGNGFNSWLPSLIVVRSTGPAPVPKGTVINLLVDHQLCGSLAVGVGRRTATGKITGGSLHAHYKLARDVPAGEFLTIPVTIETKKPTGALTAFEHPTVALTNTAKSGLQRLTGGESDSRIDSAFDIASRATYGLTPVR